MNLNVWIGILIPFCRHRAWCGDGIFYAEGNE